MALTTAQERIYHRMLGLQDTGKRSCTAYDVGATLRTMECLVEKGMIVKVPGPALGSVFSPETTLLYRARRATA